MEDPEGVLSFDFEGGLEAAPPAANPSSAAPAIAPDSSSAAAAVALVQSAAAAAAETPPMNHGGRRSFRQTVCRHWLRGLCMKGDACGFLHQYDKSRMPVCRFFRLYGECREQDCVYKHTNEDIKECNMYKLGFCPNGPDCRYRHAKLPGPPPPVEEVFQKIQHLSSFNYGSNRFLQQKNASYSQQTDRSQFPLGSNASNQSAAKQSTSAEPFNIQQQLSQIQQPQDQLVSQNQIQPPSDALPNQGNKTASPLPQGLSRDANRAGNLHGEQGFFAWRRG